MRIMPMKDEDYPAISENAWKWLSMPWVPPGLRQIEGLYTKPHLYYA